MAECEFADRCTGLQRYLADRRELAWIYRELYCGRGGGGCARYRLAASRAPHIPDDLLPNEFHALDPKPRLESS